MDKRYVSIWFPHLSTDWFSLRQPKLKEVPFILRAPSRGRMIITATNAMAEQKGINTGMVLADARAVHADLEVLDDKPDLTDKLLKRIAEWCIRFTPIVAIDLPDGLLFDATGCTHLWGGDSNYILDVEKKLRARGYDVRMAMAETIGVAWGIARYGKAQRIVPIGEHREALLVLPPQALRLEAVTVERLNKLGLHRVKQFIQMPRSSLRRRFGAQFIVQLDRALGQQLELLDPIQPLEPYHERLPCLEPIVTAAGIAMALQNLMESLCLRLRNDDKGLRTAIFKGYRVDGKIEQLTIGTNRPSHHVSHLLKLFEIKLPTIEPAWGIELFVLEAPTVEDHLPQQENMWEACAGLEDERLAELLDRLATRVGAGAIHRYLPTEQYWPERAYKATTSLQEKPLTHWRAEKLRPIHMLPIPERIDVTAPIPDYPPMVFRYKGKIHQVVKADGPERIEQPWWLQSGQHRDYYRVEDETGHRYWLFRLGHYHEHAYQWFIHGFFA